jgi:ethanolamine permease
MHLAVEGVPLAAEEAKNPKKDVPKGTIAAMLFLLVTAVLVVVLVAGLVASFFSIIYGYSRLVFALSRGGYLPKFLSLTSDRKAPTWALVVPGVLGFLASLSGEGDLILVHSTRITTFSAVRTIWWLKRRKKSVRYCPLLNWICRMMKIRSQRHSLLNRSDDSESRV